MEKNFLIIILVLVNCSMLFGATINVPADQATIQSAINAASDGDVVLVQPDTYVENINYNGKNITVASLYYTTSNESYISSTIIDGNQNDSVVIFSSGEDSEAILIGFVITNGSTSQGGGIFCSDNSSPTLKNLIITGNTASQYGGGIVFTEYSESIIENVLIVNNSAGINGGAIYCKDNASPHLINVTIADNIATQSGGGIFCLIISSPSLTNCILWDNSPQEIYFHSIGGANSVTISYTDIEGGQTGIISNSNGTVNWLEGNIDSDPLFVDSYNNNYHLSNGSPCISSATSTGAPSNDLDGRNRPLGSGYDMGCYEQYDDGTLPVILSSFLAAFEDNSPQLYWTTQSETDNLGFNIYRSENSNGFIEEECIQINSEIIPGMGTTSVPTNYSFVDEYQVLAGHEYYYWLQSVSTSNELELFGPVSAEIPYEGEIITTLTEFTAIYENQHPILNWSTSNETDNLGYYVYRSQNPNGYVLDEIIQLNSEIISGMGTTSYTTNYTYTDEHNVIEGHKYYYWLQSLNSLGENFVYNSIQLEIPIQGEIPHNIFETALDPNFPNPFNPSTTISFSIEEGETGIFTIFNIKGQEVLNQEYGTGEHTLEWNAEGLASGIYFYKLSSPTTNITKKMLLMK